MPVGKEKENKKAKNGKNLKEEKDFSFSKDGRAAKVFGLALIFFGLLLFFAFISYLFTWKTDQDAILHSGLWNLLTGDRKVENLFGRLGAWLSDRSFRLGFGIASFVWVAWLIMAGIRLVLKDVKFSFLKFSGNSLVSLLMISVVSAFLFQSFNFPWGGLFGQTVINWSTGFAGTLGTAALLLFSVLSLLVFYFNVDFSFLLRIGSLFAGLGKTKPAKPAHGPLESFNYEDDPTEVKTWSGEIELEHEIAGKEKEPQNGQPELELEITGMEPEEEEPDWTEVEGSAEPGKKRQRNNGPGQEELELDIVEGVEEKMIRGTELEHYDPKLDLSDYRYPTLDLMEHHGSDKIQIDQEEIEKNKNQIVQTLNNYNIEISRIKATIGPTVTLYEIVPAAGVRISKIKNLEDDIALSLAALGIRIIAPIPGKGTIGIEVPNLKKEIVSMRSLLASEKFQETKMELPVAIGKSISNEIFIADLAKMPHLLMAGATGQGKSVGLNAILVSLLYKLHPAQLKFVLIDPKKVELTLFEKIEKHFLAKLPGDQEAIITDTRKVINTLQSLCIEMDDRYDLLKEAQVRNIKEYNAKFMARKLNPQKGHKFLPYIVLVIDEFADLMMTAGKEVETPIARLAQLARAIGIHLVIATQRPSVNIITGTIKANFPARMAFKVSAKVDSRTILDTGGADQLIGRGDLLLSLGGDLVRLQCAFVDTPEVERICDFIGEQRGYPEAFLLPEYFDENDPALGDLDPGERDEKFEEAARLIVMHQQGSTSLIQRKMNLGYNRAGRLMDQLEAAGIVGPNKGSKARDVLISDEYALEQFLSSGR